MRIPNPPQELFAIAANVSKEIFAIDSITMIDSDEYQLMLTFVEESEMYVSVHFKTTYGQVPKIFYWFGEAYGGGYTENFPWETNTSESFSNQFTNWIAEISS